jgi:hypothetical protein
LFNTLIRSNILNKASFICPNIVLISFILIFLFTAFI